MSVTNPKSYFMKKLFNVLIIVIVAVIIAASCSEQQDPIPENPANMPYNADIDPDDFVSGDFTGNDFFPLIAGRTVIFEGADGSTSIRVLEEYTSDTKVIMGVTCMIVRAREYEDDELIEDTYDWYAQDNAGNVWYFGEVSQEIEDGEIVSMDGSWEAGVDGALPGIIMLANPIAGLWYRQEYFKGEAEDVAQVLSLSTTVTVPFGTYNNCLQTAEWSLLEPKTVEHKFYASGVGMIRAVKVKGGSEYEDLIEVE
jgi:hypothetical protein